MSIESTLLSGWGHYPLHPTHTQSIRTVEDIENQLNSPTIARGLGRSYGDSAVGEKTLALTGLRHMIQFDSNSGMLTCEAGVSLAEIIECFLPQGFFPPVVPGTQFVTVGGAIASDIHGKNHHLHGCFSEFVDEIELLNAQKERVICSKKRNSTLFQATCGGMGLTGMILSARIQLKKIPSAYIQQNTYKGRDLCHTLELFEAFGKATYSVAWLDCLANPRELGRSLVMTGEHAENLDLSPPPSVRLNIPCYAPAALLNPWSLKLFNELYYHKQRQSHSSQLSHLNAFFFPLDRISHWNRLYGKPGFLQYQFVLPLETAVPGMTEILNLIRKTQSGSFLSVLKRFGPQNNNWLSFPIEGLTLAMDFKQNPDNLRLLNQCDQIVKSNGGRIYLTKDARMGRSCFESGYPHLEKLRQWRAAQGADQLFRSYQSQRLGI